jgi:hypothetical protein
MKLRIRRPQAKLLCGVISGNFVVNSGTGLNSGPFTPQ